MTTQEVLNRLKVLSHELEDSEDIKAIDEARRIISGYPPRFINTDERPEEPGWYLLCYLSRWENGSWWIPKYPDCWTKQSKEGE